jgi:hypothetical protein
VNVLDNEGEVPVVLEVRGRNEVLVWLRVEQAQAVELSVLGGSQEQLRRVLGEFTNLPLSEEARHD